MKIIIIGGGPCGLGAAWRLNELGYDNWLLFEKNTHLGGLSASFKDKENFWWDIGGHVLFSHYRYFDEVMDKVMDKNNDWVHHDRSAWIWMQNRFIPYPVQNNIHRFPKNIFRECLYGMIDLLESRAGNNLKHFGDWIDASFGKGLAKWFLNPYNYKVWAYPVEQLSYNWVGERVARVDLKRILDNEIDQKDDIAWGPNSRFRFPKYRGTGAIWEKIVEKLPENKIQINSKLKKIDINEKTVEFKNGKKAEYDILISTIALDELAGLCSLSYDTLENNAESSHHKATHKTMDLKYSSTHIAGIGLKGNPPEHLRDKCWIYFPENDCPFYRVTVFSNYSPNNVPDITNSWSLMCEVSESPMKTIDPVKIMDDIIQGAINTKLIKNKKQIHHTWYKRMEKGYPTPSINRNKTLFPILNKLKEQGIYSRGRFGAWRYEVGNMDHSFMQGVEAVNNAINQKDELTLWHPEIVNSLRP